MRKASLLSTLFVALAFAGYSQQAETLLKEGQQLKKDKNAAGAIEKFKAAVALKPDLAEAHYEMGWCYNDLKKYNEAMASLRKARAGSWANIPRVYFELGWAFEKLNMYDSAITAYNRCLYFKPDYTGVHRQLGYIAYIKEDYRTALDEFQKYEEIIKDPSTVKDYLYWYRKGFSLNAQKMFEAAKTALQNSLEYKKDYINTYLELGFACTKLKQDDAAISWFQKAMDLDPKSHIPYNGIAEVYRDNKKDMNEAMSWYQKTLDMNSNERKANFGMGYCLNSQGKYTDAITHLRKAIASESDYTAAYVELGYSLYMTNSFTDALANLNKAMKLNQQNENARYYATLVYVAQKDKTRAQQMVDELKILNSKHVTTLQEKVNKM